MLLSFGLLFRGSNHDTRPKGSKHARHPADPIHHRGRHQSLLCDRGFPVPLLRDHGCRKQLPPTSPLFQRRCGPKTLFDIEVNSQVTDNTLRSFIVRTGLNLCTLTAWLLCGFHAVLCFCFTYRLPLGGLTHTQKKSFERWTCAKLS